MPKPILLLIVGLLISLMSAVALAQEHVIEEAIEKSRAGTTMRELQAQANTEPPRTGDKHELAIFYHRRGQARFQLGDYRRASEDLRLALEYVQPGRPSVDGWGNKARIGVDLGNVLEYLSDWFAAIEHWMQHAQTYQRSDPGSYSYAHQRLSYAYSVLGNFADAEVSLKLANDTLPQLRQTKAWAIWGFNWLHHGAHYDARFLETQGRYVEAEPNWRAALEYAEKDYELKTKHFGPKDQNTRGAMQNMIVVRRSFANNLATQGRYGEAEILALQALRETLTMFAFNTISVGMALGVISQTRFQQGELVSSENYRRYAIAAIEAAGVPPHHTALAGHRLALGNALVMRGQWNPALKLFAERDKDLRSDAAQFKRVGSSAMSWAYALHKSGQSQRAAAMAATLAANQSKRPVPNRLYIAQLRGVVGMALAATGKTGEALKAFQESIPDLIRRDQDDATAEDKGYWRAFWQRVILESYLELLAKVHASGSAPADLNIIGESFWVADVARSSNVQEAIAATAVRAQLPDSNMAAVARKEQDARNRIIALNRILSGLSSVGMDERTTKVISGMRSEIERLRKEHGALRAEIRKRYPEYAELIDPKPTTIVDVSNALAPGEALVSIYLGESQSYVWTVVAGGKSTLRVVPIKREEIESDVRELRKAVDFGDGNPARLRQFDLATAHKLYRIYFEPDEALWTEAQILNVIPHGALGELPFSLLVTAPAQQPPAGVQSSYADMPWLMRKAAIAQLPSASAFAALRRTPPGKVQRQPFVGFGDPLFTAEAGAGARRAMVRNLAVRKVADATEAQLSAIANGKGPQQAGAVLATRSLSQAFGQLGALPDTADELREIAATLKADLVRDLFLNLQATEKNVKQVSLDNRRVVAFATHGIAPGELTGLDQPALVLSNPALTGDSGNDGFLTMEEVLGLKLDADWVVLSACNTGSADGRGSEAVSGLGRAFFYAGARSLLVSNWAVETTSAKLLTTELFKRQADNPHLTRAEALRQSMLDLMNKKSPAGFSYAHPAFWAPFSLVGDGGR